MKEGFKTGLSYGLGIVCAYVIYATGVRIATNFDEYKAKLIKVLQKEMNEGNIK